MRCRSLVIAVCALGASGVLVGQGEERLELQQLLRAMTDVDWLYRPPQQGERALQFSSYDRASDQGPAQPEAWYGNRDAGQFLRTLEREGQTREMTIENIQQDYRQAGPLYESYRQVMRISGLMGEMSEKERKDLEKSKKQLEEMEAQLDQMPASARSMIEGQIKKSRAMIDAMSNDGAMETTLDVVRIDINQGPPIPKAN